MQIRTEYKARQRIRELVQLTKKSVGLQGPPSYLGTQDPIASYLGIIVKETPLPLGDEGQYIPNSPPYIIIDSQVNNEERKNFTFFHEISHHLIRQDDELYSFIHEYTSVDDKQLVGMLEHCCNVGAAEFLIPSKEVHKVINEQGFSIKLVEHLEPLYPASKPAIVIQLAQCATHKCFVVICEWGKLSPKLASQTSFTSSKIRDCLYVQYAASSPPIEYSIGRFAIVPQNHIVALAYQNQSTEKGLAPILFANGNRKWKCECEAFYYKGKVYATFNVSPPIPVEQMSFL